MGIQQGGRAEVVVARMFLFAVTDRCVDTYLTFGATKTNIRPCALSLVGLRSRARCLSRSSFGVSASSSIARRLNFFGRKKRDANCSIQFSFGKIELLTSNVMRVWSIHWLCHLIFVCGPNRKEGFKSRSPCFEIGFPSEPKEPIPTETGASNEGLLVWRQCQNLHVHPI